jgi:hypothetical protein
MLSPDVMKEDHYRNGFTQYASGLALTNGTGTASCATVKYLLLLDRHAGIR